MDLSPVWVSLKTATVAGIITFFLGILLARLVHNIKNKALQIFLDGIFTLPMVLPPTVAGFFLLFIFGLNRPIGQFFFEVFNIRIAFSWFATVLAAMLVALPIMYRAAKGAFEQVDKDLIYVAQTLGLSNNFIFWRIAIPEAFSGILAGGILAFARGLGEFGATVMIAGNIAGKTQTLPLAIYSDVVAGDMAQTYFYVTILLVFSLLVVWSLNLLNLKKDFQV